MINTNKHILSFIRLCPFFIASAIAFFSCKKFVDIDPPVNQVITDVVFTSDGMATSAITGIYSEMMSSSAKFSAGEITFYAGLSADELYYASSGNRLEFFTNQITESSHTTILSIFWDKAYKFIYTANLCLEGLEKSTGLTPSIKNMLIGECKFIRAFCYFHLVNLFGKVPLATVSDYRINAVLPRKDVPSVYKQMIDDLEDAKRLLSTEYPTGERVRPNKWTAASLLARICLYKEDWVKAETEADSVISSGAYSLESLDTVFLKESSETIWQLLPVNTVLNNTWEGNIILPPSNPPTYFVTDTLLNSFESGDLRKVNWIASRVVQSQTRYYPYKYKTKTATTKNEYYVVFRLAEQFLIRAEAKANQNKLAESLIDINTIRVRAGLPVITSNSQAEILSAIEQERKIELFSEWGHRWYDLKRTNRADDVLGGQKTTWATNDMLWPIPISQIKANPALTQNPGY